MAIMQGKQQHTAIPITHAREKQKTTKKTSNARNPTQSLSKFQIARNSILLKRRLINEQMLRQKAK
jgi:hypothetical protein